jgi:hypothetical protein
MKEICNMTSMTAEDVIETLDLMGILVETEPDHYAIKLNFTNIQTLLDEAAKRNFPRALKENLRWSPFPFKRPLDPTEPLPKIVESTQSS